VVEQKKNKEEKTRSFSSGTHTTLQLPPGLQTFFRYFYNDLDQFA